MDLNDFNLTEKAEQGADLYLEHPGTGEALESDGKKWAIRLAGTDSKQYRNKSRALQNKRLNKVAKGRKADFGGTDLESCELLASCTLGWSGLVKDGQPLEFSYDAAVDLYMTQLWIREQVDVFVGERTNFL